MHKMTFKTPLAIAVATASLGLCGVANADTTMEERFAELEARIAAAEQRAEAAERRAELAEQGRGAAPASSAPAAATAEVHLRWSCRRGPRGGDRTGRSAAEWRR